MIYLGAFPFVTDFKKNFETMTNNAIKMLKDNKYILKNDRVVIVSDVNPRKNVDILEVRTID